MPSARTRTCSAESWPPLPAANPGIVCRSALSEITFFNSSFGTIARKSLSSSGGAGPSLPVRHDSRHNSGGTGSRTTARFVPRAKNRRLWAGLGGHIHSSRITERRMTPTMTEVFEGAGAVRAVRELTSDLRPGQDRVKLMREVGPIPAGGMKTF